MAMHAANFLLMIAFSAASRRRRKDRTGGVFAGLWLGFLAVNLGYFAVLYSGIPEELYSRFGIRFSANDTMHVLLIAWMALAFLLLRHTPGDAEAQAETFHGI